MPNTSVPSLKTHPANHQVKNFIANRPTHRHGTLLPLVKHIYAKRVRMLDITKKYKTPFYLFDLQDMQHTIADFVKAFAANLPKSTHYYALKSNPHPFVITEVLKHNFGLDISSGNELRIALRHRAKKIIFSGPGKTKDELIFALKHRKRVIINIDSFDELNRLGEITNTYKLTIRSGVRFFSASHGAWSKFGIPLSEVPRFFAASIHYPYIRLQGLQFHLSHNRNPAPYVNTIKELANSLNSWDLSIRRKIRFIDIGGGFMPHKTEGVYPWMMPPENSTQLAKAPYYIRETAPLQEYTRAISKAIKAYLAQLVTCEYFTEPGRIISTSAMHIVLQLTDIKKSDAGITDGGINMGGWEWGENFYFPILNMTHPATREIPFTLFGSLCTPHDLWGYTCYAKKMAVGDIIVIPNQGAYRYSMAQNFIKPIPETVRLDESA